MIEKFIWLIFAHAIGDSALQSQWIAQYKNPHSHLLVDGHEIHYYWAFMLTAHALTNGACVAWVTKNVWFGLFIALTHWCIDLASSSGLPFILDQTFHGTALIIVCILWSNQAQKEGRKTGYIAQGSVEQ